MMEVKKYKKKDKNCREELNELVLIDMKEMTEVYRILDIQKILIKCLTCFRPGFRFWLLENYYQCKL